MEYSATDAPDLSGVTNMTGMFEDASSFDGNLSGWNVSSVTGMNSMFERASSFNGSLSGWNVSSVTDMNSMFLVASSFNQPLNDWNVSSVTDMNSMFAEAYSFDQPLNDWNVSSVTAMDGMFFATPFNQPLNDWDVSSVTGMLYMFAGIFSFNQPLNDWNVSSVTRMDGMFSGAFSFDQPLNDWDVSSVTGMEHMFTAASSFNQSLNGWDVSSATNMTGMFEDASSFDQPLNDWNVSSVTGMDHMFSGASSFNRPLNDWNVSSVTGMDGMFSQASDFSQNLGDWYIVLNGTSINAADAPGVVGSISAQNQYLNDQTPTYAIGAGGDSGSFNITGGSNLNMNITSPAKSPYAVNITSAGGFDFSNHRVYNVTVTGIVASNNAPEVEAGADQEVVEGTTVNLLGTVSDDDPGDILRYSWTHDDDPAITITGSDSLSASFVAPNVAANTTVTVTLTVNDGTVEVSDALQVNITDSPNNAPEVEAGADQEVVEGATVTLSGTVSDDDPEDDLRYSWTHDSALAITFANSSALSTTFAAPNVAANTTVTVTLTADDGTVEVSDALQVNITDSPNNAPEVEAGADQEVVEGATVTLSGTVSDDDPEDAPTYEWTHDSALAITFANSSALSTTFAAPDVAANTTITVTLTADDGTVEVSDALQVNITDSPNNAPEVEAGADQEVVEGATVTLSGTVSDDDPEDDLRYSWTHDSALAITFANSSALSTTFAAPNVAANTTVTVTLTADDGTVEVSDALQVNITDSPNNAPEVEAGADQEVVEGATVTLSGTVSDDDPEDAPTYEWTHDSALAITFANSSALSTTFAAPDVAANTTITVTLTADDGTVEVSDALQVNITDSPNNAPEVEAGADQEVVEGATVTLSGTVSDDDPEDDLRYSWTHDSALAITFANSSALSTTFAAPNVAANTTVTVTLTVNDGTVEVSDALQVNITDSPNNAPEVEAGADQEVVEGATVTLSGTVSDDDPEDAPTYEWTHDSALAITFANSSALSTTFAAPDVAANTTITVTLTADDGTVEVSDALQVNITDSPNNAPEVEAGADQEVVEGATVTLSGTVSDDDPEDDLRYSWTHDSALAITFANSSALSTTFAAPNVAANTTVTVTLTADDGTVEVSDALQVNITDSPNNAPEVEAGADQEVVEGATVTLSGTVSDDDPEDAPTYEWTHDGALAITFANSSALSTTFAAPDVAANTTITVTLTADDGTVEVSDALQVNITDSPNNAPEVEAGADQEVVEGATVTLSGTVSDDDPEDALTYSWTHDGALAITFANSSALSTTFAAPDVAANTTITVTLTADDGTVEVSDTLQVTITDSPNNAPEVEAGADQEVVEGATVTLSGTVSDDDPEDAPTYEWTHDGALAITFANSSALSTTFAAPDVAANTTITVTLTADDGTVEVSDTLQVTITDSPNNAPEVEAGADQEVVEGATVTLSGTVSDDDPEDNLTYSWTHDGALAITFANSSALSTTFTAPDVAANTTITVTLTADDGTVEVSDTLQVTITDSSNSPPTVNAGQDQEVVEGATVTLSGTATDDDPGDTLTYSWTHDSSLAITFANSSAPSTTFAAPDVAADTTITVTLTVNDGTVDVSDALQVTITDSAVIQPGTNSLPTVNVGGDRTVSEGERVSLPWSASDADGDPLTYAWSQSPAAPAITFASPGSSPTTFTAPRVNSNTLFTLTLTANDGTGDGADSLHLTVRDSGSGSGGGGSSTRSQAPALDFGALVSSGLVSIPQDIAQLLRTFDPDEPIPPVNATGPLDAPLVINGSAYLLGGVRNTLEPQTIRPGEPVSIIFTVYSRADIEHFTVYMNLQGADPRLSDSDTHIRFNKGTVSTVDPNGFIAGANVTITQDPSVTHKYRVQVDVEFAKEMGQTDMIVRLWNTRSASVSVYVINAFEVLAPAAAQAEPDLPPGQEIPDPRTAALRMWAGFDSVAIGDAGLIAALGLDYPDAVIPAWVRTGLAPLVINNGIAVDEFTAALRYVLENTGPRGATNDAAGSQPADTDPDAAAPTVTSVERSDPAGEATSAQTLVFAVTFSGDVTGVDAGDFELSPDSTGGGSAPGRFAQTSTPALAIPDNAPAVSDAITVPGPGTATSVSVSVDIAHPFTGDLTVEIVAPDGTARTLHRYSGEGTDDIVRMYAPDFGGTGIAGDWTLRVGDRAPGDAGTLNGWTLIVGHDGAGGSVTGLAGSGSRYLVTVSAPREGTYNLDVVRDSGIADAAGNPLADAAPTGADHTYTVVADTTAPTVASIVRSNPAGETTSVQTLVFAVTFGEDVTGVDAGDFALSPDSGSGPGQFTRTRMPGLAIPDNAAAVSDAITVPGPGTATSVTVSVDIAHPFIGDLTVELVAPDGTARALHDRSGGNADDIVRTYTPDFGGTGIAGDWTLRVSDRAPGDAGTLNGWTLIVGHDGAGGSVTGLAGSGSRYLVTVSAPREGTYNLDVIRDSGIADAAGNPLADAAPTGADHTYTVVADTTAPTVTSIERSSPAAASTSSRTLVFEVTFGEDVTGVDAGDFALSPDSTGGGSGPGQFTHTRTPWLAIPDNAAAVSDAITVPGSGTATSVSVSVNIAHPYIDDLTVELVAPDGTARTLHSRSGGLANDIVRTYTPDFAGTGIAGDWILRIGDGARGDAGTLNGWTLTVNHGGADSPVTGLAGSGSQYLVTVSAAREGTYNLDVIRDSGIADAAGNPLADAAPTGVDHTYTRTGP